MSFQLDYIIQNNIDYILGFKREIPVSCAQAVSILSKDEEKEVYIYGDFWDCLKNLKIRLVVKEAMGEGLVDNFGENFISVTS